MEYKNVEKVNNKTGIGSFVCGILSIFLSSFFLFSFFAIGLGIHSLSTFNQEINKNKWMAIVGIILGALYLAVGVFNETRWYL